ncbi:hypothetical protein FVEN_g9600 [Fusarium venenatum]|uniref:Uncharacterized protein n=1 Tax=Fusarium venenatum TaxID=56646 RepID=A0A2L2U1A4_9HYPO|nr:uncharacterized protein FVRRES_04307 [Fusarium venenatum]KAG8352477.1 hypothetical protein FVEN_g9600 [Fusarium venenatum]KAH7002745.1 hypothetical protein EDB82DRAFT_481937 [Fusarium venenatum]CEI67795.1 unnamed protein product [Fusarium venenatum]
MEFATVFDDPWSKKPIPLEDAAAQHLELIEVFLKLIAHLGDDNGYISDETLVYSEWRYIVYARMIEARGYSPSDIPPPWDVALIMYLHMLSPSRFHHYIYDNRSRVLDGIFGLRHRHFPMTQLLSGEWYPRKSRKLWLEANTPDRAACPGPNLPFQLWSSPPWEQKRASNVVSSVLGRNAYQPPSSNSRWTTQTDRRDPGTSKNQRPRVVIMHEWLRCRTAVAEQGFKVWEIEAYTAIRTQRVEERCRNQSQHEEFNATCGLRPWPVLQDLRAELEQQISFWKVIVHVKSMLPGFGNSLTEHMNDYKDYMDLICHVLWRKGKHGRYKSKLDPNNQAGSRSENEPTKKQVEPRFIRLLPPTIQIDLLWQTHRLYPAHYWLFCCEHSEWVVEPDSGARAGDVLLKYTKEEWKHGYSKDIERGTSVSEWFTEYVPCASKLAPPDVGRTNLSNIVNGVNAVRQRRVVRRTERNDDISGGGGAGFSGGDGGCGGDGGGGGE